MNTRKSMTFPIIITLLILGIIIYLFTSIKQTEVTCSRVNTYDDNVKLKEEVTSMIDGKKIKSLQVTKTIILPEKYTSDDTYLNSIKATLEHTLNYLGDKVKYSITNNKIIVNIKVDDNEILLLNNISFIVNDDLEVKINTNTKSSDVITLAVGDSYTDGEFMKRLKNNGYSCK